MFLRYFVELSYNGKNYHGWQIQPNANSVQETIENALSLLLAEEIQVVGCGRTDSGVHASQFYLHFDTKHDIDKKKLKFKLNAFLPPDIVIFQILKVKEEAHARFDALSRSYEYRISLRKDAFLIDTAWLIQSQDIDLLKMNSAAKLLLEYQDFKCFSKAKTDVKTFDCKIEKAIWEKEGDLLVFHITANRFLRNMVRAIVGTLIDVGTHKISVSDFKKIIESRDRTKAGASAKAKGLFLTKVVYPKNKLKK
jgi:tRNA pseudouridine38-40 synthase